MNGRARNSDAENMALARARAALDHAKKVMDAGAVKGPRPPAAPSKTPAPAAPVGRSWAAAALALAAAAALLALALVGYRSRAARMEASVSKLTVAVAQAEERQRASAELHARTVEDLQRRLEALSRPVPTPAPRKRFLGIF